MLKCYCELNEGRKQEDEGNDDREQKKHSKFELHALDVNLYALQRLKICKNWGDTTSYEKFCFP